MTTTITREGLNAVRSKPVEAQTRYLKEGGLDDALIAELTKDGKLDKQDTAFMAKRIGDAGDKANPAELSLFNGLKALDAQDALDANTTKTKPNATKYPDVGPIADVESGKVTLKKGSGGPAVVEAQNLLEKAGYKEEKFGSDGKFGPRTKAKVEEFQKANGLTVSGELDAPTLAKLREVAKSKSSTPTSPVAPTDQTPKSDAQVPAKPTVVTSLALGNMKSRAMPKDTWDGNTKTITSDLLPKLDAQGQKDLQAALSAARDARYGVAIADQMKAKEQFESYMKRLDGKLDPALAKAIRELV